MAHDQRSVWLKLRTASAGKRGRLFFSYFSNGEPGELGSVGSMSDMSGQAGFGMMKLYAHPDNYKTKKASHGRSETIRFTDLQGKLRPKRSIWMAMASRQKLCKEILSNLLDPVEPVEPAERP